MQHCWPLKTISCKRVPPTHTSPHDFWQESGHAVSTFDKNSWKWQINGSIFSTACHWCDSKCYSNEAVIIVKLRGSIHRKRKGEGKGGVRGQELKVIRLTSSTCWRLGCPSTMAWIIPVSWNKGNGENKNKEISDNTKKNGFFPCSSHWYCKILLCCI